MEISLIRHGKSRLTDNERITYLTFKKWIEKYDNHGVFEESAYPSATLEKVKASNIMITSDLKRAIESAKCLNPESKVVSDPLFREIALPSMSSKFSTIKLKPNTWAILLRVLWLSGYSVECESITQTKLRARAAARQLIDYAGEYHSVVLVGHGFFNRLIAKELQKKSWRGKGGSTKHWNCRTFSLLNKY